MKKNKFNITMNLQFFAQNENNSDNINNVEANPNGSICADQSQNNPMTKNSGSDMVDQTVDKPYISFSSKEEYEKTINKSISNLQNQVKILTSENNDLKNVFLENKNFNNIIETFTNNILEKYQVKDFKLNHNDLDFTSLDRFEKSILSTLEQKKVNYKKPNISTADNKEKPKIRIFL